MLLRSRIKIISLTIKRVNNLIKNHTQIVIIKRGKATDNLHFQITLQSIIKIEAMMRVVRQRNGGKKTSTNTKREKTTIMEYDIFKFI